jgi:hypothetical protein
MNTRHADTRSQQRGIPPLVSEWLDQYGREEYDGRGGLRLYFDKHCIRAMERDMGREPVRRMESYFGCFKVVSTCDGTTITVGHRHCHIRRK